MKYDAAVDRDANRIGIQSNEAFKVSKAMTFAGGTSNDPGDFDGTGNPATLFTVTGDVLATVFGICTVDLVGNTATLEVGVTGATALILAQTTATNIDASKAWVDASVVLTEVLPHPMILGNGQDIIQTAATANITAGAITYYCLWRPLSANGNVVAA